MNVLCGTATQGFISAVLWRAPVALLAPHGCVKSMNPDRPLPVQREWCDTGAFAVCISASAPAWRADCSLFDTIVLPQAAHGWKTALNQPPEHKLCAALYLCMPVMFWHCDHQWFESCSLMYSVLNTVNRVAVKEGMRAIQAYRQRNSFCQNIVTTHWWPKTHETSGLCEKTNSIYIVFYLLYTTMPKWSECVHASRRDARFRLWTRDFRRFHRLSQSERTHVTHRMRARTQITWTWLCTRGKKRYKYCSFSHTNRSFRVLGHQCVVTMGNCLIWISLCMFFSPLIETVTYTCHYMTDRLERFDLKISKLDLLKKKRHLHLGCPWGKLIDAKF